MNKEKFFEIITTIVERCDLQDLVDISTNLCEIATFHIIEDVDGDYLGYLGRKLFKFSSIVRVQYEYGEYAGLYSDSNFQLIIELIDGSTCRYDLGDQESVYIKIGLNREFNYSEYFKKFNEKLEKRDTIITHIQGLVGCDDESDVESAEIWFKEGWDYISNNKDYNNDEILFSLADRAIEYRKYGIDIKSLPTEIILRKILNEDKTFRFINWYESYYNDVISDQEMKDNINLCMKSINQYRNEYEKEAEKQNRITQLILKIEKTPEILEELEIDDFIEIKNFYKENNRKKEQQLLNLKNKQAQMLSGIKNESNLVEELITAIIEMAVKGVDWCTDALSQETKDIYAQGLFFHRERIEKLLKGLQEIIQSNGKDDLNKIITFDMIPMGLLYKEELWQEMQDLIDKWVEIMGLDISDNFDK